MLRAIKRRLIKLMTGMYDPPHTYNIGDKTIRLPLSHDLPAIMHDHPQYNYNLARLVGYVAEAYPSTRVIDIGANVGDSVAFIKTVADVPILCIDGQPDFVKYLKWNTEGYSNVYVCNTLVGSENGSVSLSLKSSKGTARLEAGGNTVSMRTLADILTEFPDFMDSRMIKTDTDGFDTIILRGIEQHLRGVQPVLFFEFDPHLIKNNGDDAFSFMNFLEECGYKYFIFYTNVGDYLVSLTADDKKVINELIHYFSGRKLDLYADVCAFTGKDEALFETISRKEIEHFRQFRNY